MDSSRSSRGVGAVLRRRWALIVVPVVVAAVAAFVTQLVRGSADDALVPVLVAAVAGLVVGVVAAWIAHRSRAGFLRRARDLVELVDAPNLAVVPRHPLGTARPDDVTMFRDPNSVEAEGYRTLRTALEFVTRPAPATDLPPERRAEARPEGDVVHTVRDEEIGGDGDGPRPGIVVLVTSPRPGEGKSSVAANLAAASAMAGRRVVLVDADLRKPQVHRLFRLKNEAGLASVLAGTATLSQAVQRLDGSSDLAVLSAGPPPPDPAELLANGRLGLALAGLAQAADLVVVDAPPLLPVTDPTIIVQHCDVVLLVATAGISERREWVEALPRLEVVGATVAGTVLLQPDDRATATTVYRYTPSAVPPDWWVYRPAASTDDAPADAPPAGDAPAAEPAADVSAPADEPPADALPADDDAPADSAADAADATPADRWPGEVDDGGDAAVGDAPTVTDRWPVRSDGG
jgi:capsular exopolysaccharide synthesis family protein